MFNLGLTNTQIEFLKSKGFHQETGMHSGHFFQEKDDKTYVLHLDNEKFLVAVHEWIDGGGGIYEYYKNMAKFESSSGQSLENFIKGLNL
jgi:hypothetical protein